MTDKAKALKHARLAEQHLEAAANILEGLGLTTQSDALDAAADHAEDVLNTLAAL
jgi:antitoxin component of RelBE/YafQ-DinJ toxin-antitoxin module